VLNISRSGILPSAAIRSKITFVFIDFFWITALRFSPKTLGIFSKKPPPVM
jgi:hypothetical protein